MHTLPSNMWNGQSSPVQSSHTSVWDAHLLPIIQIERRRKGKVFGTHALRSRMFTNTIMEFSKAGFDRYVLEGDLQTVHSIDNDGHHASFAKKLQNAGPFKGLAAFESIYDVYLSIQPLLFQLWPRISNPRLKRAARAWIARSFFQQTLKGTRQQGL